MKSTDLAQTAPRRRGARDADRRQVDSPAMGGTRASFLGSLAVESGRLSAGGLERSLAIQQRGRELGIDMPLGEILVRTGRVDRTGIERLLELQVRVRSRMAWQRLAGPVESSEIDVACRLVGEGVVDPDELDRCRHLRRVARDLGLAWSLERAVVARGHQPEATGDRPVKNEVLASAYRSAIEEIETGRIRRASTRRRASIGVLRVTACLAVLIGGLGAVDFLTRTHARYRSGKEEVARARLADGEAREQAAIARREARDAALDVRDDREREAVARAVGELESRPVLDRADLEAIVESVERVGQEVGPDGEYAGDLEMVLGRAYLYVSLGAAAAGLDEPTRRLWLDRARAHLERARAAYLRPGSRTVVGDEGRRLRLPDGAPEGVLYVDRRPAGYDARTGTLDYDSDPRRAASEVACLLERLDRTLIGRDDRW